jgi:hypothetical protein
MGVFVTLRQEKTVLSSGDNPYRVVSHVTDADPTGMYPLFKVSEGLAITDEQFEGVATLDDLAKYTENSLVRFRAATAGKFTAIGAVASDMLNVVNAVSVAPEWFDTYFTAAEFEVAAVDPAGDYIDVVSTKPFPTALEGLAWELESSVGAPKGSGTGAECYREDTSEATWLRRHWTSLLATVKKAESRFESIRTNIEDVVDAANTHGTSFTGVTTDEYEPEA